MQYNFYDWLNEAEDAKQVAASFDTAGMKIHKWFEFLKRSMNRSLARQSDTDPNARKYLVNLLYKAIDTLQGDNKKVTNATEAIHRIGKMLYEAEETFKQGVGLTVYPQPKSTSVKELGMKPAGSGKDTYYASDLVDAIQSNVMQTLDGLKSQATGTALADIDKSVKGVGTKMKSGLSGVQSSVDRVADAMSGNDKRLPQAARGAAKNNLVNMTNMISRYGPEKIKVMIHYGKDQKLRDIDTIPSLKNLLRTDGDSYSIDPYGLERVLSALTKNKMVGIKVRNEKGNWIQNPMMFDISDDSQFTELQTTIQSHYTSESDYKPSPPKDDGPREPIHVPGLSDDPDPWKDKRNWLQKVLGRE